MPQFIYSYSSTLLPPSLQKEINSLSPTKLQSIYEIPSNHKCFLILYTDSSRNFFQEEIKHIKKQNPNLTVVLLIDSPHRKLYRDYLSAQVDYPIHIHEKHSNFLTNFKFILSESKEQYPILKLGGLELNPNTKSVSLDSQPIKLRKKEYDLLKYLLQNQNSLVTKTELLEKVWNYRYDVFTKTVDTHIHHLKKKINKHQNILSTIYGEGYRLSSSSLLETT